MSTINLPLKTETLRLHVLTERIVRVTVQPNDAAPIPESLCVLPRTWPEVPVTRADTASHLILSTSALRIEVAKADGHLRFLSPDGASLLSETAAGAREFTPAEVLGEKAFHVRQTFDSPPDEALYGLGQHPGGLFNYKGHSIDLTQENTVIAVPMLLSSRGYGLLWDNASHSALGDPVRAVPGDCLIDADGVPGALTGEYFDREGQSLRERRRDAGLAFRWWSTIDGWLDPVDPKNEPFFVRWTGSLEPRLTGEHRLYFEFPRGGKVWLDDRLILESVKHKRETVVLPLTAGRRHALRIETLQGTDWLGAYAYFDWQQPVTAEKFTLWSNVGDGVDYYFIAGPELGEVIRGYRLLTGDAPLFPRHAFGYWQSRETYTTRDELVAVVEEHRRRRIPLDVVVQDWRYWMPKSWGTLWFNPERYPDPAGMISDLHDRLHCRLMLSTYAQMADDHPLAAEYNRNNWLLPAIKRENAAYLNAFSPDARAAYWREVSEKLFRIGVDIFWLDTTEPKFTHPLTPTALATGLDGNGLRSGARVMNAYSLMLTRGFYEGQRAECDDRRVCILTRSGFAGQQRYAAATWSGDSFASWEVFAAQIPAGLNYSLSGLPYWNTDIGGFFGGDPLDAEYRELFIRWFQFAAFCPLFRNHGTNNPKEIWRFDEEAQRILIAFVELRYRLLPYWYALAWRVTREGDTFQRPLVMDFRADPRTHGIGDQFLLGPALLVCPVLQKGAAARSVYLPEGADWYDFWTNRKFAGGQTIEAAAPIDRLPLFVRAGSVLPLSPVQQWSGENPDGPLELRIYPGADGAFTLYEDEGDGYAYEKGRYAALPVRWDDDARTLHFGPIEGGLPGKLAGRTCAVLDATNPDAAHTIPLTSEATSVFLS